MTSTTRAGSLLQIGLGIYATVILALFWVVLGVGLATGGQPLVDAWASLTGLEMPWAAVVWILLLPIAIGLWAWNEAGSPLVVGIVLVGLLAWTAVAVSGLVRALRRR